jgi:hypothetical protein
MGRRSIRRFGEEMRAARAVSTALIVVSTVALHGSEIESPSSAPFKAGRKHVLHFDDFRAGLGQWIVEQQPGGNVSVGDGRLVIDDDAGCTVWFRHRLRSPVIITYEATVSGAARVSDLNVFWMASDPRNADLFAPGHGRTGKFATYNGLRTYYVGSGGNDNSTTRFRRYAGDGTRPLRPEHDLRDRRFLIEADHPYRIELYACGGHARYLRDGEVIFNFEDPEPLTDGWFGFRTVRSRIVIRDFRVFRAECGKTRLRQ